MKKYMKFPMYQKETHSRKYREDPFRTVNFQVDEDGDPVCPNNKKFRFLRTVPVKGNRSYTRARRRGLDGLLLETALISCGFNLHKFYLKSRTKLAAA